MARPLTPPRSADSPLKIVGPTKFGRYPKISDEQTFNMTESQGFLVPTPGYKKRLVINPGTATGRAIYSSVRGNFMIVVVNNNVYRVSGPNNGLVSQLLFTLNTFFGDVFIDENSAFQIAICDKESLWIYDWRDNIISKPTLPINTQTGFEIRPGYVTFHDTYFIVPDLTSSFWYLSAPNNGNNWLWGAGGQPVAGAIQTKPEDAVAVLRVPGGGNSILVFGETVTEAWYNNGNQLFPYQRNNSMSIDYGCLSSGTIAAMDGYIVWLGVNEKSGPAIMLSDGVQSRKLTNLDENGIDFRLQQLTAPQDSQAFFFRDSGYVYYQITFFNRADNLTLLYNFDTNNFYTLTNENMDFHIAQRVAFFNNRNYITSLRDGSVYEMSSELTSYDYRVEFSSIIDDRFYDVKEIPRVRVAPPIRLKTTGRFSANNLTFTIEQGNDVYYNFEDSFYISAEDGFIIEQEEMEGFVGDFLNGENVLNNYVPRVDLNLSWDGSEMYGSFTKEFMQRQGVRENSMNFYKLGSGNDLSVQLRFWSRDRITVGDGLVQITYAEAGRA